MTCTHHFSSTQNTFTILIILHAVRVPLSPSFPNSWQALTFLLSPLFCIFQYVNSWNHTVVRLFTLASFNQQWACKFPLYLFMGQQLVSFECWITFYCLDEVQFTFAFSYWRISWWLPSFASYKENCYRYSYAGLCVNMFWINLGRYQREQLLNHV